MFREALEIELDDYVQKISGALARSPCELCVIPSRRLCNTAKQKTMSNDEKSTELPTRSSWMTVQKRSVMLRRARRLNATTSQCFACKQSTMNKSKLALVVVAAHQFCSCGTALPRKRCTPSCRAADIIPQSAGHLHYDK